MFYSHKWYLVHSSTQTSFYLSHSQIEVLKGHSSANKDTFGIETQETGHLSSQNLILVVFIRMALICSSELASEISQGLTSGLSVLFCFLPWLDLWIVNPGVVSWYLDCCGGRKYYRVGAHPCGLELNLWGPIFPDFRTWVPGTSSGGSLEPFGSWLTPHKIISCWNCPMALV